MIAQPGKRQSHAILQPQPGAAWGLIFSIVVTSLCLQLVLPLPGFWWQNMLPGILLLAIVGWRDDKIPVSSLVRLLVQLAVSLWLLGFGWSEFSLTGVGHLLVAIIVAMVWMMNLYNFMDGSNGMAGFQGVFAGVMLAFLFQIGGQYADGPDCVGLLRLPVRDFAAEFSTGARVLWVMWPVYPWDSYLLRSLFTGCRRVAFSLPLYF